MIIEKKALPRRALLKGIGVTLALPFLDAMVPALGAAPTAPRRLGYVYIPNGAVMSKWQPAGDGVLQELTPTLAPLASFKDQIVIPVGLSQRMAEAFGDGNGDHSRAGSVYLSGVHPKHTEGADVKNGITVDQIAALELGKDTRLRSLEMAMEQVFLIGNCDNGYSCAYTNSISWRTPTDPNPMETNPRVIFERLFGDGGSAADRMAQIREDRSILDFVNSGIAGLQKKLSASDRNVMTDYLDSVREMERRIQIAERQNGESPLDLPERPVGVPEAYEDHAKLMFDLIALAFRADITRVFTFTLGKEQTNQPYPQVGVNESHHAVSHHQNDPAKLEKGAKINKYHVELLAYFLNKLKMTPEGPGNVLDNALVVHGGGISDADAHSHVNLPLVLIGSGGGAVKGGRILRYPLDTPMNNLHLALLDKVGVHMEKFGDANGVLSL
jgi:Protein of unknown function (DUF1552)